MGKSTRKLFQLTEIVFSEKGNAPMAEDGCEICQHCFDRQPLVVRPRQKNRVSRSAQEEKGS